MLKIHCKRHYRNLATYSWCTTWREHFTKRRRRRRADQLWSAAAASAKCRRGGGGGAQLYLQQRARFLAAASPHSGDWLLAILITACGLRLSDESVRVAVYSSPSRIQRMRTTFLSMRIIDGCPETSRLGLRAGPKQNNQISCIEWGCCTRHIISWNTGHKGTGGFDHYGRPNFDTLARRQTFNLERHRADHTSSFIPVIFCLVCRCRSRPRCQS